MNMEEMGNPFAEEAGDLLKLGTKDIADQSGAPLIVIHYARGKNQFKALWRSYRLRKNPSTSHSKKQH